ncbi:MAG: PPC domain-containing protein [Chloroflexota bacterium]
MALLTPTSGSLPPGGTNTWTFSAQNSAVLSFVLEAESDDLDPAITLTDSSGNEIVSSDDYDYPHSLNPLLEAITMPRTDTFTLTVSSVNGTSGDYVLTMLPGYSVSAYSDDFSKTDWRPLSDVLSAQQTDEQLNLSITGARRSAPAFDNDAETFADFYAQAQVVNVSNLSGWVVGMALRREGDSYYLLSINAQGTWRFSVVEDGSETVIRDWTPHPNIVPEATSFSLGVLAKGVGFDFFYNTGYIGSSSDDTLTSAGQIGLMLGTFSSQASTSSATFGNLTVTVPTLIDGAGVIPQEITAGDGSAIVQSLKRTHAVSANGEMTLTIPEASVQYARPGVNRVMLARGSRYTNFALGAVVDLSAAAPGPAGCGVVFRFASETDYTLAYLNQEGEYGVSERDGDVFSAGLYGTNSSIGAGQHHLLLIASGDTVYYYVDRHLVGSLENTAQEGEIGIAVVNFELNSTTCSYSNLWLWQWD